MPSYPPTLPIQPFTRPVRGSVTLPGSKSITNRALLLAALCDKPVTLTGALFSEDTRLMATALRKLGFTVEANETALTLRISGQANGFKIGEADLFIGLAGTAARFLTALCSAAPAGVYRLDGVPQMRKRPMKGLIDSLRALGADIRCTGSEGFFPLEIHARGLHGGRVGVDANESSQMLSALLMVAPLCRSEVEFKLIGDVRRPFVDMTSELMVCFGQPRVQWLSTHVVRPMILKKFIVPSGSYAIEPDATAASYFLALPLVTRGALSLQGLHGPGKGLQGDSQFISVLEQVGIVTKEQPNCIVSGFTDTKNPSSIERVFSGFSDTFLTLAAIAPLLDGPTKISGIAHTRKQETDRVAGMARELKKLGQHVIETEDSLEIHPRPLTAGVEIETYHDHRFAMSFAILGCHDLLKNGQPWLTIKDPGCCAKTFPAFFDLLAGLRADSH